MSPCNNCTAPVSTTNVYNTSAAASDFKMESLTVSAGLTVTLTETPADGGFFLLFLDAVPQTYSVDYTVDFDTGVVTLIGATAGQVAAVIYIMA